MKFFTAMALGIACGVLLAACGKVGVGGYWSQAVGNWAEVRLPAGCVPKLIAGEEGNGVIVYCEDGRLFH